MMALRSLLVLFVTIIAAHATLIVKVDVPKQAGEKVIIKLTIKNAFKEKVESARAQVFLVDDKGKVIGQAVKWVIGGTKERPPLGPDAEATFNFVVQTDKPFTNTKVSFTRIVLEGGKLADVRQSVEMTEKDKPESK
jgi:hypothetical protein